MFSSYWLFDSDAEFAGTIPGRVAVASQTVQRPLTPWFVPVSSHSAVVATSFAINPPGYDQYDRLREVIDWAPGPWRPAVTYADMVVFSGFEKYLKRSDSRSGYPDFAFSGSEEYAFEFTTGPDHAGWGFIRDPDVSAKNYNKDLFNYSASVPTANTTPWLDDAATTTTFGQRRMIYESDGEGGYTFSELEYLTRTLSNAISLGMLTAILDEWLAKTKSFREATGDDETYAHATESTDGKARCAGSVLELELPTFTGDEAIYNGNFSGWVCLAKLRNSPVAYGEITTTAAGGYRRGASRVYDFPNGYYEESLSNEVTGLWADMDAPWGEFQDLDALDGCPQKAATLWDVAVVEGQAYELELISRNGREYRVTLEAGIGPGPFGEPAVVLGEVVMVTDALTMKAVYPGVPIDGEDSYSLTPVKIEGYVVGSGEWEVLADAAAGDDVLSRIGTTVTDGCLLLCAVRKRRGEVFGFAALNGGPERYRTRHVEYELTTPAYSDDGETWIHGAAPPSGTYRVEFTQSYVTGGSEYTTEVVEWSQTLGAESITLAEDQIALETVEDDYDNAGFYMPVLTETADFQRRESASTFTHKGHSAVRRDGVENMFVGAKAETGSYAHNRPSYLSEEWVPFSVTWDGTKNVADPIVLPAPDPGTTVRFAGVRLTY